MFANTAPGFSLMADVALPQTAGQVQARIFNLGYSSTVFVTFGVSLWRYCKRSDPALNINASYVVHKQKCFIGINTNACFVPVGLIT